MLTMMRSLPKDAVLSNVDSPVGNLTLIASTEGLRALLWEVDWHTKKSAAVLKKLKIDDNHPIIKETKKQLSEYFSKKRKTFDLPLILEGTEFQKKAWMQLLKIPYGRTISYGAQAKGLGDSKKARAVGGANSRNPISIIVPCHRVIGKNGTLTGFGGGLGTKKSLIELEQKLTR